MHDVVILGGGLAGLTLSIHLKQQRPGLKIAVLERREHPVPEAAHKVGESSIEVGARYFSEILGLRAHLEESHYTKPGLIFYFPAGDNSDVTKRVEIGQTYYPKFVAYQIDRGRFENHLGDVAMKLGVEFVTQALVDNVDFDRERGHTITFRRHHERSQIKSRWVVDAAGRANLFRKVYPDLDLPIDHRINASWFRVSTKVSIEDWSKDKTWHDRIAKPETRWFSTNHLMGEGYWVWLIPLASGSTSIGIVADDTFHSLSDFNSLEKTMQFLKKHEPQCYAAVESHLDKVQDYHALRRPARHCTRNFSTDRWCVVGEAGVFFDAFYSTGSDLIAIANTFATELITRDLAGESIDERCETYNRMLRDDIAHPLYSAYHNQYAAMGNPQVFGVKIMWDSAWYWCVNCLLYFQGKLSDLDYVQSVRHIVQRSLELEERMQELFLSWHKHSNQQWQGIYIDQNEMEMIDNLQNELADALDDDGLRDRLTRNIVILEELAAVIFERAIAGASIQPSAEINPYTATLDDPSRWNRDDAIQPIEFVGREAIRKQIRSEMEHIWMEERAQSPTEPLYVRDRQNGKVDAEMVY